MANDAFSQLALASDPRFLLRLKGACVVVAEQIFAEDSGTANHAARLALATTILKTPDAAAAFSQFFVMRPNVMNFVTSYDFHALAVVTTAGDADLQSQIATDWNTLTAL